MKKVLIIPITFLFITLISCGGKNMNGTADYSNRGPDYFNPDYYPHSDTNIVRQPKPFSQTTDMGEHTLDSGDVGKKESIVNGGKE
jgi:hypothetical protein